MGKRSKFFIAISYIIGSLYLYSLSNKEDYTARFNAVRAGVVHSLEFWILFVLFVSSLPSFLSSLSTLGSVNNFQQLLDTMLSSFSIFVKFFLVFLVINAILGLSFYFGKNIPLPLLDSLSRYLVDRPRLLFVAVVVVILLPLGALYLYPPDLTPYIRGLAPKLDIQHSIISDCKSGTVIASFEHRDNATIPINLTIDGKNGNYCVISISSNETRAIEQFWFNPNGELCQYRSTTDGSSFEFKIC